MGTRERWGQRKQNAETSWGQRKRRGFGKEKRWGQGKRVKKRWGQGESVCEGTERMGTEKEKGVRDCTIFGVGHGATRRSARSGARRRKS
jgi:hypothetical protein